MSKIKEVGDLLDEEIKDVYAIEIYRKNYKLLSVSLPEKGKGLKAFLQSVTKDKEGKFPECSFNVSPEHPISLKKKASK